VTAAPLALPRNKTDTQPPPATAFCDLLRWSDASGTAAAAMLSSKVQRESATANISNAAIAPPQVEQGWSAKDAMGHADEAATAVLRMKPLL
jgi:hypothetical protein